MIIFKGTDGSVAIMTFASGEEAKEDAIRKFRESHASGKYPEYYETSETISLSREFRDAWTLKNNEIVVDEAKAKQIHMKRIRCARDMELDRLDKEQLRYLHDVEKSADISEKKQILRDLPSNWNTLDWPELYLGTR